MIEVPEVYRSLVASAAADGCPLVLASVDAVGQPQLAYYGTIQVLSDGRMGWWARHPENLIDRLEHNPRVSMIYWNVSKRVMLKWFGTAAVTTDPSERDTIFTGSPESEQAVDPERTGTAFVLELARISGFDNGTTVDIVTTAPLDDTMTASMSS